MGNMAIGAARSGGLEPIPCPPLLEAQWRVVIGIHHVVGGANRFVMLLAEYQLRGRVAIPSE